MIQTMRNHFVKALVAALLLAAVAATPFVTEVAGFDGAAHAEDCSSTTC